MPSKPEDNDRAARHERADAIRRLRDKRNASLNVPADADRTTPAVPADSADADDDTASGDSPNYVDFIDRKMRQPKKE